MKAVHRVRLFPVSPNTAMAGIGDLSEGLKGSTAGCSGTELPGPMTRAVV